MKCDIIIPIWNHVEFTKSCIESIIRNTLYPYRLILIDNGSGPETRDYLRTLNNSKIPMMTLLRNEENLGFIKAVNQGLSVSNAPYVCILNNDTLPGTRWLTELIEFAEKHPDIGLLNPLCKGHSERNLTVDDYASAISRSGKDRYMEMNQCQGFCMLIKRGVIERIGHLDEGFGVGGFDDTDYSMRAHIAGYRSVCVHSSYVYHREHVSFDKMGDRKRIQLDAEKRYFNKWPRHQRAAIIFSVSKNTIDKEIENLLNSALSLARKWCWVNLLIFGGKNTKNRINTVKKKINFPLHQNIKFNYLSNKFKALQIAVRILERSFGRKRRKKYDLAVTGEAKLLPFLRMLCRPQRCEALSFDFTSAWTGARGEIPRAPTRVGDKCDIILPVCDQYEFTKKCIESIVEHTDMPYRLIIINNGTNPKMKQLLDELGKREDVESTIVHNDYNIGWVKALNKGIELSDAPYVCFQNDDTIVTRGWLRKMIDILKLQDDFGMINPSWEDRPANISIERYNSALEEGTGRFIETDWCRGFCVVIKREVVEKIGKVDEGFGFGYLDDVDYSIRAIEAGFLALRALDTYVYHERNVTASRVLGDPGRLNEKNKLICYKKWGRPLRVVIIPDRRAYETPAILDRMEKTAFYLARKQHRVAIWSPRKINGRFQHTNVRVKVSRPLFLNLPIFFDLLINKSKNREKRYNAVFRYTKDENIDRLIRQSVDCMKEETKGSINVEM